jgi:hypothetical protein
MKRTFAETGVRVQGYSILQAWEPGVIQNLLDEDFSLNAAIRLARLMGARKYRGRKNNLVVNLGLQLLANFAAGIVVTGLTYHSIGTNNTTPLISDTQLTAEVARKQFATRVVSGATVIADAFYPVADCTYNIKEEGVFGNLATGTLNSGTIFSHYLQPYDNTVTLADLTFEYLVQLL